MRINETQRGAESRPSTKSFEKTANTATSSLERLKRDLIKLVESQENKARQEKKANSKNNKKVMIRPTISDFQLKSTNAMHLRSTEAPDF